MANKGLGLNADKIRVFIGEKPLKGFGARNQCKAALRKLTDIFCSESLSRYGLKRDAETFDDLMRGGAEAEQTYRTIIEKELPVKSSIRFIAEKARESVGEAVAELSVYIDEFRKAGTFPMNSNAPSFAANPDYIRFDEDLGEVVLSPEGLEAIEDVEGYYMTNKRQVEVYDLAKEIEEKIHLLDKLLEGDFYQAIGDQRGRCIMYVDCGKIKIEVENVVSIKPKYSR